MAVRLLEQQVVAELVFVTQEGEVVLAPALALEFTGVGIEHARLADVVQREIGVGQLLLELGVGGDELDHPLAEDERVVAQAGDVGKKCFFLSHRLSTPSGTS